MEHEQACEHDKPLFDAEAAQSLPAHEVQRRWPRLSHCSKCGAHGAFYASVEHYLAGDW
jgi:hypothetical protein